MAMYYLPCCRNVKALWRPEYGSYMVEGTPGKPYGGLISHFNIVEANMKFRRQEVEQLLEPGEAIMSLTSFPRSVSLIVLLFGLLWLGKRKET